MKIRIIIIVSFIFENHKIILIYVYCCLNKYVLLTNLQQEDSM